MFLCTALCFTLIFTGLMPTLLLAAADAQGRGMKPINKLLMSDNWKAISKAVTEKPVLRFILSCLFPSAAFEMEAEQEVLDIPLAFFRNEWHIQCSGVVMCRYKGALSNWNIPSMVDIGKFLSAYNLSATHLFLDGADPFWNKCETKTKCGPHLVPEISNTKLVLCPYIFPHVKSSPRPTTFF